MPAKELTQEEQERKKAIARNLFLGATPHIASAYGRDPRTQLANAMMSTGSDTSAVSSPLEGLARALSGVAGGYIGKQQAKKYKGVDVAAQDNYNQARDVRNLGAPVVSAKSVNPFEGQGPPVAPPPTVGAPPMAPPPQMTAQPPPMAPPPQMPPPQDPMAPPAMPPQAKVAAALAGTVPPPAIANPTIALGNAPGARQPMNSTMRAASLTPPIAAEPAPETVAGRQLLPARVARGKPAVALAGNNPGGINDGDFAKKQPGYVGNNGRYAAFDSLENGTNAQRTLLRSYVRRGYDTPLKIAQRWAPKGDGNDPTGYAGQIANNLGIGPNDKITRASINQFSNAQAKAENASFPGAAGKAMGESPQAQEEMGGGQAHYALPDLPKEPDQVAPPTLPERVRSLRLATAQRLIEQQDTNGLSSDITGPMVNAEWEAGTAEEQQAKLQREREEFGIISNRYTSDLQSRANKSEALYRAPLEERKAMLTANTAWDESRQAASEAKDTAAKLHEYRTEEQAAQDKAALERSQIASQRMPAKAQNEYAEKASLIANLRMIKDAVAKNPNNFGLAYGKLPDEVKQRIDPQSVAARALLSNIMSDITHQRSGAAVTATEYPRLKGFIARDDDGAPVIQQKLDGMIAALSTSQKTLETMYPNNQAIVNYNTGAPATPNSLTPIIHYDANGNPVK